MADLTTYRRRLPHWRLDDATYFVTWRIAPGGSDLDCSERQLVTDAIRHFNGRRYRLLASVVMDDHVHVLVQPRPGFALETLVRSWKGFTGARLCRSGRPAPAWQDEYFDRIVRSEEELRQKLQYIEDNPRRRFQLEGEYPWLWVDSNPFDD